MIGWICTNELQSKSKQRPFDDVVRSATRRKVTIDHYS